MRFRARLLAVVGAVTLLAALVPSASALITPTFRDIRRDADINFGTDVCGGTYPSWNLTGSAGAAGDNWISVYDLTPSDGMMQNTFGDVTVFAEVLILPFNNSKGGGVLARFNDGPGKTGLALTISNAGNTDRLLLGTVSNSPAFLTLASANLFGQINGCAWYRVELVVTGSGTVSVSGKVWSHTVPSNPLSPISALPLNTVSFSGSPAGIDAAGQIGFFGRATLAVEDTSIADWFFSAGGGGGGGIT